MSILNPDLLSPIFDKNRDEILLIEYNGFIKNETEAIVIAMMQSYHQWKERYPGLEIFKGMGDPDIYDRSSMYSPIEYLKILSDEKLSIEEICKDIETLRDINVLDYQQLTVFEMTIHQMLKEKFVKSCYILKDTAYKDYELGYLLKSFGDTQKKIHPVSGTILEACDEIKPTTCFINSLNSISSIIEANELTDTKIFFVLRNTSHTVYYDEGDRLFHYHPKINDKIEEINNSKKYYTGTMYTFRVIQDPVG